MSQQAREHPEDCPEPPRVWTAADDRRRAAILAAWRADDPDEEDLEGYGESLL